MLAAYRTLAWIDWPDDGMVSVFHPETGETHLLNSFAAECLAFLWENGPATSQACRTHLEDAVAKPMDDLATSVEAVLRQLKDLELVYDNQGWAPASNSDDAQARR